MKKRKWFLAALVIAGLGGLGAARLADLRPADLEPNAHNETRGRDVLARMAVAHGEAEHRSHARFVTMFEDEWVGTIGGWMSPRPSPAFRATLEAGTQAWNVRLRLEDQPTPQEVWAYTPDRRVYRGQEGQALAPASGVELSPILPAEFLLPTYRYFLVAPFELASAEHVYWVREATLDGQRYDVVFATWGELAPHADADQYLIYVHQGDGHLGRLEYTVRESARSALGAAVYQGARRVGGARFPEELSIRAVLPLAGETEIHRVSLESIEYRDEPGWDPRS
ncbi:MAG: hypothetical protein IPG45_18370 [Deltaproteobacteria bacterium]|nr:hypothetical protein [Deltaproteobacteria bacterium]